MHHHTVLCTVCEDDFDQKNDADVTGAEEVTVDKVVSVSGSKTSRRKRKVSIRLVRNQRSAEVERVRKK